MKDMKVLITEPDDFSEKALSYLRSFCDISFLDGRIEDEIKNYDVLFIRLKFKFDYALLKKATRLKYIVSPTTGLDHINQNFCKQHNIKILSLKEETDFLESVSATAELSFGLIISILRKINEAANNVKLGSWQRDIFKGNDLKGKTLGILGVGRVGKMVAKYGNCFGMQVIGYDINPDKKFKAIKYVSFDYLLKNSNIISIHLPLNENTKNLISKDCFNKIKFGTYIINTSRGQIIDEKLLLKNLEKGYIKGAAIDVLSNEKQGLNTLTDNPLIKYAKNNSNLIITPHIGGASYDAMKLTEEFMAKKLLKNIK